MIFENVKIPLLPNSPVNYKRNQILGHLTMLIETWGQMGRSRVKKILHGSWTHPSNIEVKYHEFPKSHCYWIMQKKVVCKFLRHLIHATPICTYETPFHEVIQSGNSILPKQA